MMFIDNNDSDNNYDNINNKHLKPSTSSILSGRRRQSSRTTLLILTTRGGGDEKKNKKPSSSSSSHKKRRQQTDNINNKKMKKEDVNEKDLDQQENEEEQQQRQQRRPILSLSSPFYLNELARYEASMVDDKDDVNETDDIQDQVDENGNNNVEKIAGQPDNFIDDDRDKTRNKKTKKKKHHHDSKNKSSSKQDSRTFMVGGSTATTAETTLPDDGLISHAPPPEEQGSAEIEEASNDVSDIAKLWWVNMWTQQLSDGNTSDNNDREGIAVRSDSEPAGADEIDGSSEDDGDDKIGEGNLQEKEEEEEVPIIEIEMENNETEDDVLSSSEEEITIIEEEATTKMQEDFDGNIILSSETVQLTDLRRESVPSIPESQQLAGMSNATNVTSNSDKSYVSSGVWVPIDNLMTLGLASRYSSLRLSKKLRGVRKLTARVTGLHGALSGKPSQRSSPSTLEEEEASILHLPGDEEMQDIQRRIAAIDKARKGVERARAADTQSRRRRGLFRGLFGGRNQEESSDTVESTKSTNNETAILEDESKPKIPQKTPEEIEEDLRRLQRVREIDKLIAEGQKRLADLICEKDVLQRRPNPLFEYTTTEFTRTEVVSAGEESTDDSSMNKTTSTSEIKKTTIEIQASRKMNFPPEDLVAEYLEMMISTGRLEKMNHTYLWKESENSEDDEEETIGDDIFTASADAHRLYRNKPASRREGPQQNGNGGGGGGSWLLRQSIGSGPSLGEKIGETVETAAYKAVCAALMSFLAKALSSLHGINVMKHSDIRLWLEQAPDLPIVGKDGIIPGSTSNYAEETIKTLMSRKSRKYRKRSRYRSDEDSFVQRDAVTEMLLSHVQISAPLLKLFPTAWQRALLGNIITLSTAVVSDFLDGLSFQMLGHQLSFSFRPITEEDMIRHFQIMSGRGLNHRRYKAAEFEAAVRATAEDVSEELKFLDRWHERALGSGVLRTQIANMIARIVLTLTGTCE
jgi:hypothetical protein